MALEEMKKDSKHPASNLTYNEASSQQSPNHSFQCSHCVLIFKSKLVLLDHVSKAHGHIMQDALHCVGSESPGRETESNPSTANSDDDFASSSQPQKSKHKQQRKESSSSLKATSKPILKDLRSYLKQSGKITNYLTPSVSNVTSPAMNLKSTRQPAMPNDAEGTLFLQECPAGSKPNNNGVLKITATSSNDLRKQDGQYLLLPDPCCAINNTSCKPDLSDGLKEPILSRMGKRTYSDSSVSTPAKKYKQDQVQAESTTIKSTLSSSNFTVDFSDDDEEESKVTGSELDGKAHLANTDSPKIYHCKHCYYNNVARHRMVTHYEDVHPYIRCKWKYIQDPKDHSATFRCLECPVEFSDAHTLTEHYTKSHPDTPDIFPKESREIDLVFKCFVCPFTTQLCQALKEHYREKHPQNMINNSLMYYRYSAKRGKESSRSDDVSLKSVPTPNTMKTTTSPESPTSKGMNVDLYKCQKCTFSSKSAVAMLVHYQKTHPKAGVTLDKIKQSHFVSSDIEPTVSTKSSTYSNTDVFNEVSHVSHQKTLPMSLKNICVVPEVSPEKEKKLDSEIDSNQNKASKLKAGESPNSSLSSLGIEPEDKDKHAIFSHEKTQRGIRKSTSVETHISTAEVQRNAKMSTGSPKKYDTFPKFYCQVCDYTHHTVRGVIGHQSSKHMKHFTIEETMAYNAQVQKWQAQSKGETSKNPSSCSNVPKHLVDGENFKSQQKDESTADTLASSSDAYEHPENLFYCQNCNFGHPSIKGILTHQNINHRGVKRTAALVFGYTAVIRGQIKAAQSERRKSPFNSGLPLPLLDKDDESMLFCFMCNYGHKSLNKVMAHIKTKHPRFEVDSSQIIEYSSKIHYQIRKSHQTASSVQALKQMPLDQSKNETPKSSHHRKSSSEDSAKSRLLTCYKCTYQSPRVYLLKRHLYKIHKTKHTVADVLQIAFDAGLLQAGYHCEWCVYSSKTATKLHQHCQKQHESRKISIEHIKARLHVGLKGLSAKRKKSQDPLVTSPSRKLEKNKRKAYPCRACSFKGSSLQSIASHYHAVHPWSVKEDGSVLDVISSKVLSVNSEEESECVQQELPETFQSYQVPIDFETQLENSTAPSKPNQCRICSMLFSTKHGLHIHYGIKHPDCQTDSSDLDKVEPKKLTRTLMFKCQCCTYVNTSKHGILTHCQMKHPSFRARAEKLQTDEVELPNINVSRNKRGSTNVFRFGGYRCKICPVACVSLKDLRGHYEQDHNQSKPNLLKPLPKHSAVNNNLSRYHSTQGSILKALFKKPKSAAMKCNFCRFACKTKMDLTRHLNIYHKNASNEERNCVYKCSLCSYSSPFLKYLAKHYTRQHGKTAFLTYYVPLFKQKMKKLVSPDHASSLHPEGTSETCQQSTPATKRPKKPSLIHKCQLCSYTARIKRYLAGHYKRTHGWAAFKKHYVPLYKQQQAKYSKLLKAPEARCIKCKLQFKSLRLLSVHYTSVHKSDIRADFTLEEGSQLYKCGHCHAQIKSITMLCGHLERHREISPLRRKCEEKLTEIQTSEEPAPQSVTEVEAIALPRSLPASLYKPPGPEEQNVESRRAKDCSCQLCGRTFMSLTGLRNHERSHAAIAALRRSDALPASPSKHLLNKYISYHAGSPKPFRCEICLHRTTLVYLLKKHLKRKHKDECLDITSSSAETASRTKRRSQSENRRTLTSDLQEDGTYSEPPDIQRQLNHYSLVAQASALPPGKLKELKPPEDKPIHCELCNFTTEHMSSVRRHYRNRHSKKLLRCKDCWFVTGSRQTLKLHRETGHSNCPSEPTHQKVLRCPLCLYQTKNKNNMIDHIVLHREERVIPIEVRRPKLSRYLQGIVFRCHKCTYTSASAENLCLHIQKHDDVKPYKCRLCYFDCTQLSELEAHLCDKHQVMRNHELVGQINVDQLEARVDRPSDGLSSSKQLDDEDEAIETQAHNEIEVHDREVETEGDTRERLNKSMTNTSGEEHLEQHDVPHQNHAETSTENDLGEKQNEEPYLKRVSAAAPLQGTENTGVQCSAVHQTQGQTTEGENLDDQADDKPSQPGETKDDATLDKNATENGAAAQASKPWRELVQISAQNPETKMEEDILRQVLELDEDGSTVSNHNLQEQSKLRTVLLQVKQRRSEKQEGKALGKALGKDPGKALGKDLGKDLAPRRVKDELLVDAHREMPVLENEYLKRNIIKPSECNSAYACVAGDVGDMLPLSKDDKLFTCKLCGRNLISESELERHIMRHGM